LNRATTENHVADKNKNPATIEDQGLEMVMRDVLDNMLEISLEAGFRPTDTGFEILEVSAADATPDLPAKDEEAGEILDFPSLHQASA
jgi:N-acetylglucosamine kinase-like BadF-type ATPase